MRLARAAVLSETFCWISITPSPALAQLGLGSLVANIASPSSGSTVSGAVTVTASASDNVGVAGVQFRLDGSNLGGEDTSSPYSVSWSTTAASNGSHTLTARARDAAGNATTSSTVTVTVFNGAHACTTVTTATSTPSSACYTISG